MPHYPDTQLFIAGEWRPAKGGQTIPVLDPATHDVIGQVAHAGVDDLDLALASVDRGFREWSERSAFERNQILRRAANLLRERVETIAPILSREQGKPLAQARIEINAAADITDWFAEEARRSYGRIIPSRDPKVTQLAFKTPVGPVAAFSPWNFPIAQVTRKIAAGLAVGCSLIVKAPEETPASPAELIRAYVDAGVPGDALALVFGNPAEISEYLIPHPVIRKVTFTGSTVVGKKLAALAGAHMKRVTMELGGHAPTMIFADADIEAAVRVTAGAKYRNAGQVCVAPTRFMVEDAVAEDFTDRIAAYARNLRVGPGLEEGVDMGPLANGRRLSAMEGLVADALERGARLVTGGKRIGNRGNFFEPTVLADVPVDAVIMNDEPFGPIAIVNRVNGVDAMVGEANRLRYALASYAFTGSDTTARALARTVRAGMLTINHNGLALPEVPFGGLMDSGYGSEGGSEAIDCYLDTRFVSQFG